MTRENVVRMALEAGFAHAPRPFKHWRGTINDLERFAALIIAAERESVARRELAEAQAECLSIRMGYLVYPS